MNADFLELPDGMSIARKIDGMREMCQYNLNSVRKTWRWDTIINGELYFYTAEQPWIEESDSFLKKTRPIAIEKIKEQVK